MLGKLFDRSGSPFTPLGAAVLLGIGVIGVAFCLFLVGRRKLTLGYAMVWVALFCGLNLLVAFPPLLRLAMALLGTTESMGALRLLALVVIVAFLIFFSVRISVLTFRFEELVQRTALAEYDTRHGAKPGGASSTPGPPTGRKVDG